MKQIQGTSYNINEGIVGRITFGTNIFRRSNYIFVSKDVTKPIYGYCATITTNTSFNNKGKACCIVESIEDFNEGDVIVVNKNGEIIFVYEINSTHNSIFVTGKCNHRCIMCPQPPVLHEKDMTPFNIQLISLFDKNTFEVGITGGEPTLIGDNLFVLIKHIQKELPKSAISILSNGVKFADRDYAMKLAKCHHHDLQIDVPLFSDVAKEHNRIVGANTFYKTVQGLYNLALFRQRIGLRIVVHKQTYKRLPQLAEYIYHNFPFVSQVAFIQMETIGMAENNIEELWIDPHDYNTELRESILLLADRGLNPVIYNAQLCVLPKDIQHYAQRSISDWKEIYLPECDGCSLRGKCAGFFESNKLYHSKYIKKIENISDDIC